MQTGNMVKSQLVVPEKTAEIMEHYITSAKTFPETARNLSEEQISKKKYSFEMKNKVIWKPTGYELIAGYNCHEIHHRAQISVVLRILDAKVPGI